MVVAVVVVVAVEVEVVEMAEVAVALVCTKSELAHIRAQVPPAAPSSLPAPSQLPPYHNFKPLCPIHILAMGPTIASDLKFHDRPRFTVQHDCKYRYTIYYDSTMTY